MCVKSLYWRIGLVTIRLECEQGIPLSSLKAYIHVYDFQKEYNKPLT